MRIWKLISGIVSIVLAAFVIFQSSAAGLYNAMSGNNESGGTAGLFTALLMIAGGVVSIAIRNRDGRNRDGKGGNIALIVLFGLGALIGFTMAGSYSDLMIWAGWCLVCAVLALLSVWKDKKQK